MLRLNDDKTEFIVFKSKHNANTFTEKSVQIGGTEVDISSKVRILVNAVSLRRLLSEEECKVIVHTFVISKLYYCNVLRYDLPRKRYTSCSEFKTICSVLAKVSTSLLCHGIFIGSQLRRRWIMKFCFILIRHLITMRHLTLMKLYFEF